jgi:galactokinase/mevalonate kinase-like predicted kinase
MQTLLSVPENLVTTINQLLPSNKENRFAISDPEGSKIGSGGGTAWLLGNHCNSLNFANFDDYLSSDKKIIIHAGGQSRRLPAYAPSGKILTPIPVFRWSRGQSINQNLLQLQLPLYEELMEATSPSVNTLIASGDVLILANEKFHSLPQADIICLGIWADAHLASRHGVFFMPRSNAEHLSFMLQKPSHEQIEELTATHLFLMDVGIWLLSDKAVKVLMHKCGWCDNGFTNTTPDFYDLYSTFGTCLGTEPTTLDEEINKLTVAIYPLENGEFYHYGTNLELITSTEKIQNRIKDQKAIWHNRVKPHPSLFVQNSQTDIPLTQKNHHVWIENSHIASSWELRNNHILTGIPHNNWQLSIPENACLDIIPINDEEYCIRTYSMQDTFSGKALEASWMNGSLVERLQKKGISLTQAKINAEDDIQNCALFPIVNKNMLSQAIVEWMLIGDKKDEETANIWLTSKKLSANEISANANLVRLFKQREEFANKSLPKLAENHKKSVFYQVNLKELAQNYATNNLKIPHPPSETEEWLLRARYWMFKSETERNFNQTGEDAEKNAHDILRTAIINSATLETTPRLNVFPDQIVWARSPARLDLAGGWSDTPPYCLQSGGAVINMAIDMNGQPPLQVFIRLSQDYKITLRSIDNGVSETITKYEELNEFNKIGSAFSIPRAALWLAGFNTNNKNKFTSLEQQLKEFGGGIEISLLVAIPKGSGLGTSSILGATIIGALSDFCQLNWDKNTINHQTLILEQMLTTGGGWQDQYGGILPGVKLLLSQPGLQTNITAKWLPEQIFKLPEYRENWLLYYTGITRVAKNILSEIVRGMFLNEGSRLDILDRIKNHAYATSETIKNCNYEQTAQMIAHSWKLNKQLDPGTNTPETEWIITKISDFAYGYKLLGAGGGGYLLICAKDKMAAHKIKEVLTQAPPNNRARFVDMAISDTGLQISRS